MSEKEGKCLHCGYHYNVTTPHDTKDKDRPPQPGDLAICMECGGWTIYGKDGEDRKPNDTELVQIRATPFGREAERVAAMYNQRRTTHQTIYN